MHWEFKLVDPSHRKCDAKDYIFRERGGNMRAKIRNKNWIIDEETGAVQIVEMTLIFPLVILFMGFLIYMASYVLQSVVIYNDAQRIAVAASREAAMPGYENLYGSQGVTATADFQNAPNLTIDLVNAIMKNHKPYRYWGNGFLSQSQKSTLEDNMIRLVNNSSFLSTSSTDCTITTNNYFLSQQIKVRVVKHINTPQFVQYLGLESSIDIDVIATAVVNDPAEFIRNTDMIFDLTDFLLNNIKIGGQTINERIVNFKNKFSKIAEKIGISW